MIKCGILSSSCLSSIISKSFQSIVEALIAGRTDPAYLVSLIYGNRKNKQSGKLKEALTGNLKAHHRQELLRAKQKYEMYHRRTYQKFWDTQNYKLDIVYQYITWMSPKSVENRKRVRGYKPLVCSPAFKKQIYLSQFAQYKTSSFLYPGLGKYQSVYSVPDD